MSPAPVLPDEVEEEGAADELPAEELVVSVPQFLHDILLYAARIAAGLLCQAGAISIDEARAMSGIKPLSVGQRERIIQMLKWERDTGVIAPIAWHDLWYEKDN